jgi:hypothetical protein
MSETTKNIMKPKDIFNLAIRLLGLIFVYLGFKAVPLAFVDGGRSLLFVACYFAVAWWLIGGAPFLMDRAYPDDGVEPLRPSPSQEPPARNPMSGTPP